MARGHYHLRRIGRVRRAERSRIARDARINFAVRRAHREIEHRSLRHIRLRSHFRRGIVRRTDDEISFGIRRRHFAIRKFLRLDVSRRVRIAGGRLRAIGPGCRRGRGIRYLRKCLVVTSH